MLRYRSPQQFSTKLDRTNNIIVNKKIVFRRGRVSSMWENDDLRNTINYVLCLHSPQSPQRKISNISIKAILFRDFQFRRNFTGIWTINWWILRGQAIPRTKSDVIYCLMCVSAVCIQTSQPQRRFSRFQDVIE